MSDRNIIQLTLTSDFLASTEPTEYECAYYPLHAGADKDDDITLDDFGLSVTVETDLPVQDWIDRQDTGDFEDGSGFHQRYYIGFVDEGIGNAV